MESTALRRSGSEFVPAVRDLVLVKGETIRDRLPSHIVAFDTEGTGLIPYGPPEYWGYYPARPFAFSFCDEAGNTAWIRWRVDPRTRRVIPGPKHEQEAVRYFLGNPKYTKVGHHIAYDKRITEEAGFPWQGEIHDTMVMGHVVTAGDELSYALKPLSKKYCKFPDRDEKELENAVKIERALAKAKGWLIAGGKKEVERGERVVFAGSKPVKADYWLVPFPRAVSDTPHDLVRDYGAGDAIRAMLLFLLWWPELESDGRLMDTYRREMMLFHALRRMERRGTRVYPKHTNHLIQWYRDYMVEQRRIGNAHGGHITKTDKKGRTTTTEMNYSSSPQLMQKFYVERGYPMAYKERKKINPVTGEVETKLTPTLGKDELAVFGAVDEETGHPKDVLAKAILEWRAARQTISSFLNIYSKFWYPEDWPANRIWVLHPNYNQCGAVTGRLTCSDPNLQQVASATTGLRKSDIPQRPRECFGPRPGCLWYLPDYSQIEVWLFAFMSGEHQMQDMLLSGYDFHQGVADRSFVKRPDYEARKKYYRKLAKLIMFGKLYGGGVGSEQKPGRMTKLLQMPFHEAKAFIESFDEQFARVKSFMDEMVRGAKRAGEAWNLYGRKYKLEADWAYKVVNYLIQGTAADVLKCATIRLDWMLDTRYHHPQLGLLNTVHDELIIEVPYELHSKQLMREIMWVMQMDSQTVMNLPVALPVGMKITTPMFRGADLRKRIARWSDTTDVAVRSQRSIKHWIETKRARPPAAGKEFDEWMDKQRAILGGFPYRPMERDWFTDVATHMAGCPLRTRRIDIAA